MTRKPFGIAVCVVLSILGSGCAGVYSRSGSGGVTEAPAVPAGLAAAAGDAQVRVTWSGSANAAGYHVKRGTASGGPYAELAATGATSYNDNSVTNGTRYFYVVSAYNAAGQSADSAEVSATPAAAARKPNAPTGLQATPGNAQVNLAWAASTGATSYNVKRSLSSGGPYTTTSSPGALSYADTGLRNGTQYFYVVSAVNAAGESPDSSEVHATPTAPLSAPGPPNGLQADAGNAQVGLTWNASAGATSYHLKRSTASGGPYAQLSAPVTTSATDSGLTNGKTYFYVVSALNSAGESADSAEVSATPAAAADVTVTIDPTKTRPISPYIYGINFYNATPGNPPLIPFDRAGGNRWTAYNWENNASNAGSDFLYENDNFLSSSSVPAEAVRSFIAENQAKNIASLFTVQMQGLVSADENGPVSTSNPPDLTRFKTVVDKKSTASGAPFTVNPSTGDASVYMDEFVWTLGQKLPGNIFSANAAVPSFIELDNEPELWNSTHLEVQGATPVTSDAYISKTINLTRAIKDQFPSAVLFGPVHYGFQGIYNWQGELPATPGGSNWFPDKYLSALKTASAAYGKPLVDVYDFHWYSEIYDANGTRILNLTSSTLTDQQVQLIVQSPRDLWDPTFRDDNNSNPWIFNELGQTPINILGRLQSKLASQFPGMKVAITEYENGGWNHIAGTIAQADNLGIFGAQGVFAAAFWPPSGTYSYALAGFRAFRGFDGANACFGDISVAAASSSVKDVMVYASTDSSKSGRAVFVAINRSTSPKVTAINGMSLGGTAHFYQMTASTAQGQNPVQPVPAGTMAVSGSSFTITLPALSVTTIVVE